MLNLKSVYLYFLAIKIIIIKSIKKIYFTTNFYNRSLNTITPKKIFFFPNPFLLSSLTNYRNFSFKLSKIDPDTFWDNSNSLKDVQILNKFLWLNLIDRKNDIEIIKKIISNWIKKNNKYKKIIWSNSVLSNRVISWIINSDIILGKPDEEFKANFFNSIIIQINHLKKNVKFEDNFEIKIEILSAILLTGLVFKEYSDNFDFASKELEKAINSFFDNNGFPLNKNPSTLLKTSKYLVLIKECIKDAQKYTPDYLDEVVQKNLNYLKIISTPTNELPLFNGSRETNIKEYFDYLKNLNYQFKKINLDVIKNIKIINNKKNFLLFDSSEPPKKNFSSSYQSGPLSIEYYIDNLKVITNCGYGEQISKKAILLSRLTSAQSTLSLNDNSVVKFERNKIINSSFGNLIKNSFKIFDENYNENDLEIKTSASHDAYLAEFGYIHKRKLTLLKKSNELQGTDCLILKKQGVKTIYNIRFHLYPGIAAVKTIKGDSVLIQVKKNKSFILESKDNQIDIEKSIFLGRNRIINNICITISGEAKNKNKIINWVIKKK